VAVPVYLWGVGGIEFLERFPPVATAADPGHSRGPDHRRLSLGLPGAIRVRSPSCRVGSFFSRHSDRAFSLRTPRVPKGQPRSIGPRCVGALVVHAPYGIERGCGRAPAKDPVSP